MRKKIEVDPGSLTDRELLLIVYTQQTNHLNHHDMFTKVALTAGLIGIVNFGIAVLLILIQSGILSRGGN
jgi:hypothetical protein